MKLRLLLSALLCFFAMMGYSQFTTIGLIGDATPGGWDADTPMVQDPDSANLWTLEITLIEGGAKFRAPEADPDDPWAVNWGAADFPGGIGTQGGANIPISYAGTYDVSFNSTTGEYYFDIQSDITIIGDATPGGWDADTKMYPDTGSTTSFSLVTDLVVGGLKFRNPNADPDNAWAVNWGAEDFPSGIGTQDGANIPIDKAGEYKITFDTATGAYNFEENVAYTSISLIGEATPGGWDADTYLTQDANDPNVWSGNITMTDGKFLFRANDDWNQKWGGPAEFPMDTAVFGGEDLTAVAGEYLVSFNTESAIFNFLPIVYYESVSLIGDAADGWETDRFMERSETDSAQWNLRTVLTDGEVKFRAPTVDPDNPWAVNWGGAELSGIATQDGPNTVITAGEYIIDFNTTTGAYNFEAIVVYDTIGIVGGSTPTGSWDEDFFMDKDPDDELLFIMPEIALTDMVEDDEGVKFRAPTYDPDNPWTVNWGGEGWPSGVGTQDGPNIPTVAGTYRVSFRTDDGSYSFDTPSDVFEPILKTAKIYPNPAENVLNIELNASQVKGNVNIELFDVSGKRVLSQKQQTQQTMTINVSGLNAGNYFIRIYNDEFVLSKPVSIAK